jgi:YD repeat-containing protein
MNEKNIFMNTKKIISIKQKHLKKKHMKLQIFFLFWLVAVTCAQAQTVRFAYDPAGNRISRTIIMSSSLRADAQEEPKTLIEQLTGEIQVKIYPNPTRGMLQVEISGNTGDAEPVMLSVFDTGGKQLQMQQAVSNLTLVNLSSYPEGIYILRLLINGKPTDYKIIKQ